MKKLRGQPELRLSKDQICSGLHLPPSMLAVLSAWDSLLSLESSPSVPMLQGLYHLTSPRIISPPPSTGKGSECPHCFA